MKSQTTIAVLALGASALMASGAIFIDADERVAGPMGYVGQGLNAGVYGEVYDTGIAPWQDFVGANASLTDFTATVMDYPNGAVDTVTLPDTLGSFLGGDAGSLSRAADSSLEIANKLIHFTGFIEVEQGFMGLAVGSDDGFALRIGDNFVSSNATTNRPFEFSEIDLEFAAAGLYEFELFYYANNFGFSGLEVYSTVAGGPDSGAPGGFAGIIGTNSLYGVIPAPASMGVLALGGLVGSRRRR